MKIQVSTNDFKDVLGIAGKIKTDSKKSLTASDLLIQATNDSAQFIKSNGETTLIYNINRITICHEGKIILPIESAEIIKKLKENYITITDDKITTDRKEINFNQPNMIEINTYENLTKVFEVSQKELLRMLEVTYAVAQDDTRPILAGIVFDKNNTCALDGFRMSVRYSNEYNNESSFVVNAESIEILKSILKPIDNHIVSVYYDKDIAKFEVNNVIIIAKCLQGEFIKYSSIIPDEYRSISIVNSEEFMEEIEFIKSADGRIHIKLVFTGDEIIIKGNQCKKQYSEKLSLKDQEVRQKELDAEYKEKYRTWVEKGKKFKQPIQKEAKFKKFYDLIPISDVTSKIKAINNLDKYDIYNEEKTYEIGVNPNYLIDALKQYNFSVELQMTSSVSPIIITNSIDKGLELVLPVRLAS